MPKGLFSAQLKPKEPTPLRYPKSTSFMWSAEYFGLDNRVGSPIISNPTDPRCATDFKRSR